MGGTAEVEARSRVVVSGVAGPPGPVRSAVTDADVRRWLRSLHRPDRLAEPRLRDLLSTHQLLPDPASDLTVGKAAVELLLAAMERMRAPDRATRHERLPYLVLRLCDVERAKVFQAANKLGLSERQLTRERARAIAVLREELVAPTPPPAPSSYRPHPVPRIRDFLPRPALVEQIERALVRHRLVVVAGPPGIGKTSTVAEVAAMLAKSTALLWCRFRPGITDSAPALLFELGEYLASRGSADLDTYLSSALPDIDPALAGRLALRDLALQPHLMVFDDFQFVEQDDRIRGMIEDFAARLADIRIIVISRHRDTSLAGSHTLALPALVAGETERLMAVRGAEPEPGLVDLVQSWTSGIPHLVSLAATWLRTNSETDLTAAAASLNDLAEVQAFLLESITELLDPDDRGVLEAASIFRDQFTDQALAYVADQTRGAVMDASRRLVNAHIATRSRTGDCAFFHASVRDYVYQRLDAARRATLHTRAAEWATQRGLQAEATHHRGEATRARRTGAPRRPPRNR
jgi:ATP/maltotriose-dependent transcriptional regulator MalT